MAIEIKEGYVVQLKSGGIKMVVLSIDDRQFTHVAWWSQNEQTIKSMTGIPASALVIVEV